MAKLKLYRDTRENIDAKDLEDGALYIATDTREMCADIGDERIVISGDRSEQQTYTAGDGISIIGTKISLKPSSNNEIGGLKVAGVVNDSYVNMYQNSMAPVVTYNGTTYSDKSNIGFIGTDNSTFEIDSNTGILKIKDSSISKSKLASDAKYSVMTGATASSAGKEGLVPAPGSGQQSYFLRGDGIWAAVQQGGNYDQATSSTLGLVKIGYTENGQNYPVELDNGQMFVNVPWTDTVTTYTAGAGLSLSGTTFSLDTSGATAGSYGPTAAINGTNGTKVNIPQITIDAYGRVTSVTNREYTSVDNNTTYTLSSFGITATATELNKLDGCTTTVTELNYLDGVTSNIQAQLNNKAASSHIHAASDVTSGTFSIDRIPSIPATKLSGTISSENLPSYVDDVLECSGKSSFPETGESGKIYVDTTTNLTYRWSGSTYVEISPSLALGTTSSTAFRGDYGNIAYTHATAKGSAFASGLYKITTNNQGHVTAATAVTKADITALGIPAQDTNTTYSQATSSTLGLIKIGYSENGKNYPVELNNSGQAFVNVPWTDTNTTYTLSSFGITATAAELNYTDGVTSNIQTQLNNKMSWATTSTAGQFDKTTTTPTGTTRANYNGYLYATRVYNAVFNDYAELFPKTEEIEVGHIAYATENGVRSWGKPKTCVGIVSDQYGHLLGGTGNPEEDEKNFAAIAVAGRVPLEISGSIEIGDLVAATNDGRGKKANRFTNRNRIIGKVVGLDPKGRLEYKEVLVGGY